MVELNQIQIRNRYIVYIGVWFMATNLLTRDYLCQNNNFNSYGVLSKNQSTRRRSKRQKS